MRRLLLEHLENRDLLAAEFPPTGFSAGDLNRDNILNVDDVQILINELSRESSLETESSDHDVNRDGIVTACDSLNIINAIEREQNELEEWLIELKPDLVDATDPQSHAIEKYQTFLKQAQAKFGRDLEVTAAYAVAMDGLAIRLTHPEALQIAQWESVEAIHRPGMLRRITDAGPAWIGAPSVWNGTADPGRPGSKGAGVVIGVLDSGIDFDNVSFSAVGPTDGYAHVNPLGSGNYLGVCNPSNDSYDASVICNDKLYGIYDFTPDTDINHPSFADHGSHTAGIAAGNVVVVPVPGVSETATISGVAPHANIIAYDVCRSDGLCYDPDLIRAIDQAILDQVDVLNVSLGGSASGALDSAFLNARAAGVFVSASAGNSGPESGSVGFPAASPWVTSVANTTHNRTVMTSLSVTSPSPVPDHLQSIPYLAGENVFFPSDLGPLNLVDAAIVDPSNHDGCTPFPAGAFANAVALIDRGTCFFVDKIKNAADAGATAVVIANNRAGELVLMANAGNAGIPSVFVRQADGAALHSWASEHAVSELIINAAANLVYDDTLADIVYRSSSRGPSDTLDFLLPNLAAPGTSILAAVSSEGNDQWDTRTGTSMASPHVSGAAALLIDLYPEWTPGEIQSALMLTAVSAENLLKEDQTTTADPFDVGAGRINLEKAAQAGFVLNESRTNFVSFDTLETSRNLNLVGLVNREFQNEHTWTRVIRSTRDQSVTWTPTFTPVNGVLIDVEPAVITLAPGASQAVHFTVDLVDSPVEPLDWTFGELSMQPDIAIPSLSFPVGLKWPAKSLGVVIPKNSIREGQTNITGEVFRTSDLAEALTVNLSSSDNAQITVPTTVTMEAGARTAPFTMQINNNDLAEFDEVVTIVATANDHLLGRDEILIFDDDAPKVESVIINHGNVQRSMVDSLAVAFDSIIELDETTGEAFEIRNLATSTKVDFNKTIGEKAGRSVVRFEFLPGPTTEARGSRPTTLVNGDYQLRIFASRVKENGVPLDANAAGSNDGDYYFTDSFFRKYGDVNGNRTVDLSDFSEFRSSFGLSTGDVGFRDELDADANGSIDLMDFSAFRRQFGA